MENMQSFFDAMNKFAPDCHDAMFVNMALVKAADSDIEPLLQGWASLFKHTLRGPGQRNSFDWLSHDDALAWVTDHLTRDLVFRMKGAEEQQAADLVALLSNQLGHVQAMATNFIISNWTFCDLIVMSNESTTLLLAFLGED